MIHRNESLRGRRPRRALGLCAAALLLMFAAVALVWSLGPFIVVVFMIAVVLLFNGVLAMVPDASDLNRLLVLLACIAVGMGLFVAGGQVMSSSP